MSSQLDPAAHIGWGERQTDIYPVDHFRLQRRVHRRLTHHEPIGLLDKLGNGLPAVRISARTTGTYDHAIEPLDEVTEVARRYAE